MLDVDRIII
jgi:PAS domain S-box-containing protein